MTKQDREKCERVENSLRNAERAKDAIHKRITANGYPEWFRGVGIMWEENGEFSVTVRVSEITREVRAKVPYAELYGVKVHLEKQGPVSAR